MKYSKPEVNLLAVASHAIQGSADKSSAVLPEVEGGPNIATSFAYEADE
jgi:hypothetical protein